MATTLSEIVPHVDRFTDTCRRFFFVLDRWSDGCGTVPGLEGVNWELTRSFEVQEINTAFQSLKQMTEALLRESLEMEEGKFQEIVRSAATLCRWALEEAGTGPFSNGRFGGSPGIMNGSYVTSHIRKAVGWLSFFTDIVELQEMHITRREVLQALLERGPTKGDDLANNCTGADFQASQFRDMLSDMVKDDLLSSGRGRYSTGYRLTDRGMQLAQLSGQLTDF